MGRANKFTNDEKANLYNGDCFLISKAFSSSHYAKPAYTLLA